MAAFLLIRAGVEKWQRSRYEKRIQTLESQFREADAKAKEAEALAAAFASAIEAKQAELRELEIRAQAAETALRTTRTIVVPLKETYEKARNTPVVNTSVSCADVCKELAGLGHPCQ
jgi:chromosome segregation ATPase